MISKRTELSREALSLMGIPVMYQGFTWEDYTFISPDLERLVRGYTEHCDAMAKDCINLLLIGSHGAGKSLCASIILQYCYTYYYSCRMTSFKSLISRTFNGEGIEDFLSAHFLVIDELGAENPLKSQAEISLLEEILKARFTHGLPTIICSNLSLDKLKERYGNTFYSMLSEFVQVKIEGADGRREAFRKKDALKYLRG